MTDVINKILFILFGLFLLFIVLSWAVPEFNIINEQREDASETENEEDTENNQIIRISNLRDITKIISAKIDIFFETIINKKELRGFLYELTLW